MSPGRKRAGEKQSGRWPVGDPRHLSEGLQYPSQRKDRGRAGQQSPSQQQPSPLKSSRQAENNGAKPLSIRNKFPAKLTNGQIQQAIQQAIDNEIIPTVDSGFELREIVEALANSGKVKDIKTLEAAINYIKQDIAEYLSALTNTANGTKLDKRENVIKNIEQKLVTFSEQQQDTGPFCCQTGGSIKKKHKRKTAKKTKSKTKRKWSKKYKDSINCKKPKGFSQRQHCLAKSKKRKTAKKN